MNKAENKLVSGETVTTFKDRLKRFPQETRLSQEDKQEIIRNATSIAGHTPTVKEITDEATVTDKQLEACTYVASQILCMPPRWATDWWYFLKDVDDRYPCHPHGQERPNDKWGSSDKKWKEVIDLLARHCRSMIGDDPSLHGAVRRRFKEGLRRSPTSGDWELSFPVNSTPETGQRFTVLVSEHDSPFPFSRWLLLHPNQGWRFHQGPSHGSPPTTVDPVKLNKDLQERLGLSLAPPTTWALMLLQDLLCMGPTRDRSPLNVQIHPPLELWAFTDLGINPQRRVWVPWPAPRFLTFWEFDVFLSHWNAGLTRILGPCRATGADSELVEPLVYAWLDAGAAVLAAKNPFGGVRKGIEPQWTTLVDRIATDVVGIASGSDLTSYGAQEWLARVAYFVWPVISGIKKETAEEFFNSDLSGFWYKVHSAIEQYVMGVCDDLGQNGGKELVKDDWAYYRTLIKSKPVRQAGESTPISAG